MIVEYINGIGKMTQNKRRIRIYLYIRELKKYKFNSQIM
jgi:hypothetical protein